VNTRPVLHVSFPAVMTLPDPANVDDSMIMKACLTVHFLIRNIVDQISNWVA